MAWLVTAEARGCAFKSCPWGIKTPWVVPVLLGWPLSPVGHAQGSLLSWMWTSGRPGGRGPNAAWRRQGGGWDGPPCAISVQQQPSLSFSGFQALVKMSLYRAVAKRPHFLREGVKSVHGVLVSITLRQRHPWT